MGERMKKILVVEDNEQNLYLMVFILRQNGYRVVTARNGVEGIERARYEIPDLIIMDIQLPEMDGYEAAERIKSIDELRDIPIVAVTSYAMAGDREKAMDAGCSGYIEKPFNPVTFISEIKRFIREGDV
jgi:two-component system cell cycle response regulator DivK